jgi:hypothetical protein
MSTLKVTGIQHPSALAANIVLNSDETIETSGLITETIQHPSAVLPNLVLNADGTLSGDGPIGVVKQIAIKHYGTRTVTSSTNAYVNIFTLDVTPVSATSTLIIVCQMAMSYNVNATAGGGSLDIAEGGTSLSAAVSPESRIVGFNRNNLNGLAQAGLLMESVVGIVSVPSTGTTQRTFQARCYQSSATGIAINRVVSDVNSSNGLSGASSLICIEVE